MSERGVTLSADTVWQSGAVDPRLQRREWNTDRGAGSIEAVVNGMRAQHHCYPISKPLAPHQHRVANGGVKFTVNGDRKK